MAAPIAWRIALVCSVTTLLHMDGVMLRWIVIGCAILTMAACSSGKKPGVDPCTGIDASTDPALQAGDREILRQTLDRQTYWLIHDDLNADRACEAARADDLAKYPVGAQPAAPATRTSQLTDAQIDRMTTFATMIGRGIGCGLDVGSQTRSMGNWLNQNVRDNETRRAYTAVVETAVQTAAVQQAGGQTPDTCAAVESGLRGATIR